MTRRPHFMASSISSRDRPCAPWQGQTQTLCALVSAHWLLGKSDDAHGAQSCKAYMHEETLDLSHKEVMHNTNREAVGA